MAGPARAEGEREDLVDALTALGMSEVDADVYLRLSTAGPQKAGPLAKLLGWNRAETYRVLQRLVENEFVEAALTRPVEFRPVPVASLFARLQRLQQDRLARIDASRATVEDRLSRLQKRVSPGENGEEAGMRVFHDRARVLAAVDRMVAESRTSVRIVLTSPSAVRALASAGILANLERKAREGIVVEWVASAAEPAPALLPLGTGVRRAAHVPLMGLVLVDGEQALSWLRLSATSRLHDEDESAMWTDAPEHVALQAAAFGALWGRAS